MKKQLIVKGIKIGIDYNSNENDYFSLTDIVKNFEGGSALIEQWLRNKDTILFLGTWEKINNPDFNSPEFDGIRNDAGTSSYYLSVKKWIERTNATGITAKAGRYGGTYAHKDIVFEFCSWLSPEFKLYLIKEYQRLREEENRRLSLDWQLQRELSKVNYRIHTDAIKDKLILPELTQKQISLTYASEADMLNVVLFGMTAAEWQRQNPEKKGNIRDYATIEQLLVLSNIENYNSILINKGIKQSVRMEELHKVAKSQLASLSNAGVSNIRLIDNKDKL